MNIISNFQIEPKVNVKKLDNRTSNDIYEAVTQPDAILKQFEYSEEGNRVVWKPLFKKEEWDSFLIFGFPVDVLMEFEEVKIKHKDIIYLNVKSSYIDKDCDESILFSTNTIGWQYRRTKDHVSMTEIFVNLFKLHNIKASINNIGHFLLPTGEKFGGNIIKSCVNENYLVEEGYLHFDFNEEIFRKAYSPEVYDARHSKGKSKELTGLKKQLNKFDINNFISDMLIIMKKTA